MTRLPTTKIGGVEISRVTCGSNQFLGYSHFSGARDRWLKSYFTVERIVEVMLKCAEFGVNAIVSGPEQKIHEALELVRKSTGGDFHWICTPGGGMGEIYDGIKWCAERGVRICMPHTSFTDPRLNIHANRIEEIEPVLASIREHGMVPGLSTHRPEVLNVAQSAGYDVETCILPLNVIGFLCAVETDWMARVIQGYAKPVICIKPFAAGRVMPRPGLDFVFRNNKPIDTVCCGFLSPDEAEEDLRIALEILEGEAAGVELTYSRSKKALTSERD